MSILELIFISIAISIDSFATSIMIGINEKKLTFNKVLLVTIIFATFQSLMPALGYIMINILSKYISAIDHFIAFFLLLYVGIKMIIDKKDDDYKGISLKEIIILSIAVTIDAFAVGITYSILNVSLPLTILINFLATFLTSVIGMLLGSKIGNIINKKANIFGGIILILIGIKILLEHLNII